METTTIDISPEAQNVAALALPVTAQARALLITDDATLKLGNELLLSVKDIRKQIADTFDPLAKKAHEAHKAILEQKKKAEAPLVEAENLIKPQIAAYMEEAERKRKEEEERIRKEAERKAEEEALNAAIEAEASGAPPEEVDAIACSPVFVPEIPTIAPPKLEGVAIRKIPKVEVTDLLALVKGIAAGQVPVEAVVPNDTYLRKNAHPLVRGIVKWPGVRAYEVQNVAAGRRAG